MTRRPEHAEAGTRALLDTFATGDPDGHLQLGELFSGLGKRSFGMLLFVSTVPAFIPIPGLAGALSGPLVVLVGLQLLVGLRKPWLPGFVARRGPRRASLMRFRDRLAPWLARLERVVRPRWPQLLDHRLANLMTGVQLVLLGILLLLPLPFTNLLFGALLLLFALALLERDGRLMGIAWLAGAVAIGVFGVLSGALASEAARWVDVLV